MCIHCVPIAFTQCFLNCRLLRVLKLIKGSHSSRHNFKQITTRDMELEQRTGLIPSNLL